MAERFAWMTQTTFDKRHRRTFVIVTAVVIAVAFQSMLMARGNYEVWRPEVIVIELCGALVGSLLACPLDRSMEQRGLAWARSYIPSGEGPLFHLLSIVPPCAARAAVMTAVLSIPNTLVVPTVIYREEVAFAPVAILVRFLADIPQAVALCLLVRLTLEWYFARKASRA